MFSTVNIPPTAFSGTEAAAFVSFFVKLRLLFKGGFYSLFQSCHCSALVNPLHCIRLYSKLHKGWFPYNRKLMRRLFDGEFNIFCGFYSRTASIRENKVYGFILFSFIDNWPLSIHMSPSCRIRSEVYKCRENDPLYFRN